MKQKPQPASYADDDWRLLTAPCGGEDGLGLLFTRHKDYVYRLAWGFLGSRSLAEDVTQEVFLRLAKGRSRWWPRAKFRTWLYQVTLNTAREFRRRRQRDAQPLTDEALERQTAPDPPTLARADLSRALDLLPQRQREVVVLRFYEGLSTKETARIMRCREGTIKSHLHRALATLRQALSLDFLDRSDSQQE